jgi:hypothetical protein
MEIEFSSLCSQEPAMGHSRKSKKSVYTLQGRIQVWWGLKFANDGAFLKKNNTKL